MGALRRAAPVPDTTAGDRPFLKRRQGVAPPAAYGEMAAHKYASARRVGSVESFVPKYTKMTRNGVDVEMEVVPIGGEMLIDPAVVILRKRMASELDALRDLVKKAEILSRGKNAQFLAAEPRPEEPMEAGGETPPAKRRKVSPLMEKTEAPRMTPEDSVLCELKDQLDKVAEKLESAFVPEAEDEYVDICGGASPDEKADESSSSDSGSSASYSDSDCSDSSDSSSSCSSDSESSESDSDESVSSPAPPPVLPKKNDSPAPPPEPALLAVQITEPEMLPEEKVITYTQASPEPAPEKVLPRAEPEKVRDNRRAAAPDKAADMASLLAKAQEALEIRRQKGNGWEKEKFRRHLREVERAALPDESIHPRDMERLGIAPFEYIVSTVRPRVDGRGGLRAPRGRPSVLQKLGFYLKPEAGEEQQ